MRENRRTLGWLLAAYLFLLLLSAYRQLGLRDLIPGGYHPLAVYLGYTVLLAGWFCALYCRVNPSNLRYYLYAEIAVMLLWEEVRFCQEQFLWKDLYALRVSGYGIAIPLVMVPLLGLYGALVLDKNVDYRIPPRWYLLIIPAAVLILLMLTNEAHHLMFVQASGEIETNLYFHPNWGIYLLALWSGTDRNLSCGADF